MLLRNQLYAGIVDVPEYGVRGKRGDFDPLISEDLFYRVQSVLVNRVTGGDPSTILGTLRADGRVYLVNPRGIIFGAGSQIDVGGLVATTLELSDAALKANRFDLTSRNGTPPGSIVAAGAIRAPGGTVVLAAPTVSLTGSIDAARVGLAAASAVTVDVDGDGLIL